MKYIKSNIGFIVLMALIFTINFIPAIKAVVLRGILATGFFEPDAGEKPEKLTNVKAAPNVNFISSSGEKVNIADAKGKVIFLNFWASWCPPCLAEMPSINSLKEKLNNKESVIFLMVDVDNKMEASRELMKKKNYNLPVFVGIDGIPKSIFRGTLPTTLIIDKNGNIVFEHEGMANYDSEEMLSLISGLADD